MRQNLPETPQRGQASARGVRHSVPPPARVESAEEAAFRSCAARGAAALSIEFPGEKGERAPQKKQCSAQRDAKDQFAHGKQSRVGTACGKEDKEHAEESGKIGCEAQKIHSFTRRVSVLFEGDLRSHVDSLRVVRFCCDFIITPTVSHRTDSLFERQIYLSNYTAFLKS